MGCSISLGIFFLSINQSIQSLNNMVTLNVPFKEKKVQAKIDSMNENPEYMKNKIWIVLTHGAGGDMNTAQLSAITKVLVKSDFIVFRFTCKGLNIKYRINVYAEMLKFICKSYNPKGIFVGGRSMGARAAVMLSEKEVPTLVFKKILGVICLSYPLHKVNQTSNLRDEPLRQCKRPLFFLSGNKDEMCKKELLEKIIVLLKVPYKVFWLEGYDHSAASKDNFEDRAYIDGLTQLSMWCKNTSTQV